MRLSIERIRTLVVVAAVLLLVAIGVYLAIARFRPGVSRKDIPQRLGANIQVANGVTYTQNHGGRTIFKIHAAQVVQQRNNHSLLHDVTIEMYGADGTRTDRIEGAEFEYDQAANIATADGTVKILLDRPGGKGGQIHVETDGVTFNQMTGMVTTDRQLKFDSADNVGEARGATYDSQSGLLVLEHDVHLVARHGAGTVNISADHGELDRTAGICTLRNATAESRGNRATATEARVTLRDDGSVEKLEASKGLAVATEAGSRLAAPTGTVAFSKNNQPERAHLEGGVVMESASAGRTLHGSAPNMNLEFASGGDLRHAHLERGVVIDTSEQSQSMESGHSVPVEVTRRWRSQLADIEFRGAGPGRVEPATLHGIEGVEVTGETRRGTAAPVPSRMAADDMTAQFGPRSALSSVAGTGHAALEGNSQTGSHETATGDRLVAHFIQTAALPARPSRGAAQPAATPQLAGVENAMLDGRVVLVDQPAAKPGAPAAAPLRATAGHAVYESTGTAGVPDQLLHLTVNPHVSDGGMDLTADKVDVDQSSGDAFARGNVKATWVGGAAPQPASLGGSAPSHVVAAEAQIHQATGEATFRGHARLWQEENSISAPAIVLDRERKTLAAQTTSATEPVVAILLNAPAQPQNGKSAAKAGGAPAVIRVRGGNLVYSDAERKATVRSSPLASVVAETGTGSSASDQLEVFLAATGGQKGPAPQPGIASSQVDRVVSTGHVNFTSQGRRGTGSQLVYTAQTDTYLLTGTAAAPPRISDPDRGTVTGEALLFNGRDDSVRVEGGTSRTTTETTVPR